MTVLVHRTHIKKTHKLFKECDFLCLVSKNLYNTCLYQIRQFGFLQENHNFVVSPEVKLEREQKLNNKDKEKSLFINQDFFLGSENYTNKNGEDKLKKSYAFQQTPLYHCVKSLPEFRTKKHIDYNNREINTKILKQTIKQVEHDFSNFLKSLKAYKKNPDDFLGKPKIPNYKTKGNLGRTLVTVPKDAISVNSKKNILKFGMTDICLDLSKLKDKNGSVLSKETILEAKIVPTGTGYDILISYLDNISKEEYKQIKQQKKNDKFNNENNQSNSKKENELNIEKAKNLKQELEDKNQDFLVAGLDLGVNNLCSLASNNPNIPSMIVKGCDIKSINQFYNKTLSFKQEQLSKNSKNTLFTSNSIQALTHKRNNQVLNKLHCASKQVVDYLTKHNVHCVVIGKNDLWKQKIKQDRKMGSKTRQSFTYIPFAKLIELIKYKCERVGITVVLTEESYTSKCSFLDKEKLCFQGNTVTDDFGNLVKIPNYVGKRVKRGLFKTKEGILLNADINGALNMIRKVFGDGFAYQFVNQNSIARLAVSPMRVGFSA